MKIDFPISNLETPDASDSALLDDLHYKMPSLLVMSKDDSYRKIIEAAFINGARTMDNKYMAAIIKANNNFLKINNKI